MFGRRDRCLLVLSQRARVPYQHLARLTAGDISITTATVTSGSSAWTVTADAGPVPVWGVRHHPMCGPSTW